MINIKNLTSEYQKIHCTSEEIKGASIYNAIGLWLIYDYLMIVEILFKSGMFLLLLLLPLFRATIYMDVPVKWSLKEKLNNNISSIDSYL